MGKLNVSKVLLTVVLSAMSVLAGAQPRSEASAEAIARQFSTLKATARKTPRLVMVKEERVAQLSRSAARGESADAASFFVFNDEANDGFVIISGDERQEEVLGYSDQGKFNPEEIPCGMRTLLSQYNKEYELLQSQGIGTVVDEGNGIMAEDCDMRSESRASTRAVTPLVKTTWGQGKCYYEQCPVDPTTNQRCVTGCVATAMAQIMNFHQYPKTGQGYNAYTSKTREIDQSMNFANVKFDWSNMKNSYNSSSSSKSIKAVSTLMHACGVSVYMNYSSAGSGSNYGHASYALVNYFKYNPNLRLYLNKYFTSDEWEQLVQEELKAGRPILLSGSSDPDGEGNVSGHAFVLDGSDKSGRYHINWGWNGSSDGYFKLTSLGTSDFHYTNNQWMVCRISPKEIGPREDPWYAEKFEFNASTREMTLTNVGCYCADANNYTVGFNGFMGWELKNISTGKSKYNWVEVKDVLQQYYYTSKSLTIDASMFEEGASYYLYPVIVDQSKSRKTHIRTTGGKTDYYLIQVKNGKLDVTVKGNPNVSNPKLSWVSVTSDNQNLNNMTKNDILVLRAKLKNSGATAKVKTRLRIFDKDMKGVAASGTVTKSFSMNSETTVSIEQSLAELPLGQYYATIQYLESWGNNKWKYSKDMLISLTVKQESATTPKILFVSSSAENKDLENLTTTDNLVILTTFKNTGKTGDVNVRFKIWDDNLETVKISDTYTCEFPKDEETTIRAEYPMTEIQPGHYFAGIQYQKTWDDNKWYYHPDLLISFNVVASTPDLHFVSVSCENSDPNSLTQDDVLVLKAELSNNGLTESIGTRLRLWNENMEGVAYSSTETRKFKRGDLTTFKMEFPLNEIPVGKYKATIQYFNSWTKDKWIYNEGCIIDIKVQRGTAILDVQNDVEKNGRIYDLNGRRLTKPGKGIIVVDGKKILVR